MKFQHLQLLRSWRGRSTRRVSPVRSLCDSDAFGEMLSAAGFDDITFTSNKLNLNLGSLNEAVQLMTQLGPAAKPYGEASSNLQKQARESIEAVLSQHESASESYLGLLASESNCVMKTLHIINHLRSMKNCFANPHRGPFKIYKLFLVFDCDLHS